MHKQISIALAAGLLMAGVSIASATEMQRPFSARTPTQHNIYAGHNNAGSNNVAKGQQHAALGRAPWHNAD
jgi:hypothetical protein